MAGRWARQTQLYPFWGQNVWVALSRGTQVVRWESAAAVCGRDCGRPQAMHRSTTPDRPRSRAGGVPPIPFARYHRGGAAPRYEVFTRGKDRRTKLRRSLFNRFDDRFFIVDEV